MERRTELRGLSQDHHHTLVLAKNCEVAARSRNAAEVERQWDEAGRAFAIQLEPHFALEERLLLPALEELDERQMAERIRGEHEELRRLIRHEDRSGVRLRVFAELLSRHVRYEEREVFERTQSRLPASVLEAIAAAHAGRAARPSRPVFDPLRRLRFDESLASLPGPDGACFRELFRHGSLSVEIYAPRGTDPQAPHARDEAYIVMRGRGYYVSDAGRQPFGPGDFLFAPAGVAHRFEEFSDDLILWVLFYGPEGGERSAP